MNTKITEISYTRLKREKMRKDNKIQAKKWSQRIKILGKCGKKECRQYRQRVKMWKRILNVANG